MRRKALAEMIGTFWLVFGGIGSAVLYGGHGVEPVMVALAFGLTVVTMMYAIGPISGAHFNPAVTVGLIAAGRFDKKDALPYIAAQVVGGLLAAALLFVMLKDMSKAGAHISVGENRYADGQILSAVISELVLPMFVLIVILGVTSKKGSPQMAGLVIGLCLALVHMIGMGVTGVSVNPARSLGPALFSGTEALKHVWLFLIIPPVGAFLGAMVYKQLEGEPAPTRGA